MDSTYLSTGFVLIHHPPHVRRFGDCYAYRDNGAYYRSQEDFFLSLVRSVRERAFFGGDGDDR